MKAIKNLSKDAQLVDMIITMTGHQGERQLILNILKLTNANEDAINQIAEHFMLQPNKVLNWYKELTTK